MPTEAEKKAVAKWKKKNKATISVTVYKEDLERFDEYCRVHGTTRNALLAGFIESCIGPLTKRSARPQEETAAEAPETTL